MQAAIHRRYHAMHLHRMRLAINTDFRHFCHVAPKRFHHRNAPVAPRSHRFAPSRLFRRQFQHSALPRILAQQPAPEFKRIFPRSLGHFLHETFRDVPIVRISHRPPESHWHSRLRQQILHQKIRYVIFQRRNAFRRRIIQPVLHRAGEKPRHDRGAHNPRLPRHRCALVVQPRPQLHHHRGPVVIVLHIVFARPRHLHRCTHSLRKFHRLNDKIRLSAPSESSAEIRRVHAHLFRFQPRDLCPVDLRKCLELRRRINVAAVRAHVRGAVHRLHRCMRQERHLVYGLHFLCRAGHRSVRVAVLARNHASLLHAS